MTCHLDEDLVPDSGTDLAAHDVYEADGKVAEIVDAAAGQVRVALNCEQLKTIYRSSTASLVTDFENFANVLTAEASIATSNVYTEVAALNDAWETNPARQRLSITVCIRWRWLRIYVRIKF